MTTQWETVNNQLTKTFTFSNFMKALEFTNQVGEVAEKLGHHPTITLTWGRVEIASTTHDTGNTITEKDWELAKQIDSLKQPV